MQHDASLSTDGTDYGMGERIQQAVAWMLERAPAPARVRVIGDDDCDGVTSVHILATSLRRAGYEVEPDVRPVHSPAQAQAALASPADLYVIADAGSAFLDALDQPDATVLIFDHHAVQARPARHAFEVNPRRVAGDRVFHVSASVLCGLFAGALDARNWDLAFAGVAGGISDRQHSKAWTGLIGRLLERAVKAGTVTRSPGYTLPGATVAESIMMSLDPYLPGFAGDASATVRLLADLRINPGDSPLHLSDRAAQALARRLDGTLPGPGTRESYPIYGDRLLLHHPSSIPSVIALARLLEAATATGAHHAALALLAGSREAASEIETLQRHRTRRILPELRSIAAKMNEEPRFRWSESSDPSHTGVYAHALLSFVFGDDKPLVVVSTLGTDMKASARGSPRLFLERGLDLSEAVRRAATAAGGHGGGHPGAAGATVPAQRRSEFLGALDASLAALERGRTV